MKPNIIFVLLDGYRWDRIHVSPEFSELQKEGTLFNNVTAAIPYTVGAVNVIFSGLYGKDNGIDAYYKVLRLKESVRILPQILQENNYFTSCDLLHDKVVPKRGYDIHQAHTSKDDQFAIHSDLLKKSFEMANGKPVFSFIHYTKVHDVVVSEVLKKYTWDDKEFYENQEQNLKKLDELFKETGSYAKKIKSVIDALDTKNNTIIIFFSDHGTAKGERFGERNYGSYTFEETIRTFYLFIGKNILKNRVSETLHSTVEILPTVLELCEISSESNLSGKSFTTELFSDVKNDSGEYLTFSETGALHGLYPSPEEPNVFCVKTPEYKLIYFKSPNEWKLFNLKNDPEEKNDLCGTGLSIEDKLKSRLLEWISR